MEKLLIWSKFLKIAQLQRSWKTWGGTRIEQRKEKDREAEVKEETETDNKKIGIAVRW